MNTMFHSAFFWLLACEMFQILTVPLNSGWEEILKFLFKNDMRTISHWTVKIKVLASKLCTISGKVKKVIKGPVKYKYSLGKEKFLFIEGTIVFLTRWLYDLQK